MAEKMLKTVLTLFCCIAWLYIIGVSLCLNGAKKVRSAIKLCSYYFSYYVSNGINVTGIL